MKSQKKNIVILLIVLAIILYFCLSNDFVAVINEIKKANPIWILVAIIYVGLYILIRAINLNLILRQFKENYSLKNTFKIALATSFFDSITPFSSGGQPAQIYMLKKDGFKVSEATNSVIQYSVVYQIGLVLFGIMTIILNASLNILEDNIFLRKLIILGFGINLSVVIILLFFSFSKRVNVKLLKHLINFLGKIKIIKNPEEKQKTLNQDVEKFVNNSKQLLNNRKLLIKGVLISLIGFTFLYITPLFISYSLNDYKTLNIINTLVSSSYVMMIGSFVPIPGGSGGIEYGFLKFFSTFFTGGKLKAIMLLWRFTTYYLVIIVGGISFILYKRKSDLK